MARELEKIGEDAGNVPAAGTWPARTTARKRVRAGKTHEDRLAELQEMIEEGEGGTVQSRACGAGWAGDRATLHLPSTTTCSEADKASLARRSQMPMHPDAAAAFHPGAVGTHVFIRRFLLHVLPKGLPGARRARCRRGGRSDGCGA
jgi:hypothetical protein